MNHSSLSKKLWRKFSALSLEAANQLIGCSFRDQQPLVHHGLQVPLQGSAIDFRTELFAVLDHRTVVFEGAPLLLLELVSFETDRAAVLVDDALLVFGHTLWRLNTNLHDNFYLCIWKAA